jgi:uncharacterized protein
MYHIKIQTNKSKIQGIGVFAKENIQKDEIIEICPVIYLEKKDTKEIDKTLLFNYYFSWEKDGSAIALGKESLYNHSYKPNAIYKKDFENNILTFIALKKIKKGEEVLVNYNGNPDCQEEVWFNKY